MSTKFPVFSGLVLASCLACAQARAQALPAPRGLTVTAGDSGPVFHWDAVPQARAYRLAVFSGSRLLAAVWVQGTDWTWGGRVLPRLGRLESTKVPALKGGESYRFLLAAAGAEGAGKSPWSGGVFSLPEAPRAGAGLEFAAPPASEDFSVGADLSPEADASASTPEAVAGPTPASATAQAGGPAGDGVDTLSQGQGMLAQGQWQQAQALFRDLCARQPKNALAWQGLGDAYLGQEYRVEAMEAYRKSLGLQPQNPRLQEWMKKNVRQN